MPTATASTSAAVTSCQSCDSASHVTPSILTSADSPHANTSSQDHNSSSVLPRLSALENDLRDLVTGGHTHSKNTGTSVFHHRGRRLRRVVSLYDSVDDMLGEADRRAHGANAGVSHTNAENLLFKAYGELLRWIPSLRLVPPTELKAALIQVGKGADSARNEDTHRLKVLVVHWLMEGTPKPYPPLTVLDKSGRGFYNDVTGKLLCPVDYDWNDPSQRQNVRDFHPDFLVTAQSWPAFLYADETFDPEDPAKGLFRGALLVRAFKAIFISPTSAEDTENDVRDLRLTQKRRRGNRRTRENVASIMGMKTVVPRAIAYVACQLRFALSSCGTWCLEDGVFDARELYDVIVEWFDDTPTEHEREFVAELLLWWNRQVFGPTFAFKLAPDRTTRMSVAKTLKRRRLDTDRPGVH